MPSYMVHKHEATKAGLHWDLRLEQNGVLKSWAIPKGMPRKSGVRHLAIQTPDHDLSYGKWEGTIPEGSYGAGKVTIDASGEYQTIDQTKKKWKFQCLTGKYKGTWTLIHWKNKQWLIIKGENKKQSYSADEQLDSSASFCFPCEVKTNTIKGSCVICNQWKPNCPTCGSIGKRMLDKDRCVVCDSIHWDQLFGEADHMAFQLMKLKERYNLPDEGDFRRAEDEHSDKQVELAIKRTHLSMVRTGLALTTFGIVLWNLWMNKKQAGQIESILDAV